jgi:hypothetical protein
VGMVDALIAPQKRRPFRVDNPRDFGLWVGITEKRGGGQSVDNVTERTRFDDEDRGNVGFQNRLVIPGADEESSGEMLREAPRDRGRPLRFVEATITEERPGLPADR